MHLYRPAQAFEHYDDNLEHSIWLNLIYERFKLIYRLLEANGMFWIHLDDVEVHYCKVVLDEIFSRHNFVSHITYERSAVADLGQGGYLVNTTEHILLYKKGVLPDKVNLSYEELGFNIIKRYNRYVADFGERKLVREFTAKSNGEIVRFYEHTGVVIETISLRDVRNREAEIRSDFAAHIDALFRGNRVQKENEFQDDIIGSLEKGKFYSVDYIPSRGKNKDEETTLYYNNCELLSWLKDTTTLENGMLTKSQKMTTLWKHGEIPKADIFWKQSVGNEKSYLFVTTRHLNSTFLDSIKDSMEDDEYLIIACRSFESGLDKAYDHITLKKIPQMLLSRCEFARLTII